MSLPSCLVRWFTICLLGGAVAQAEQLLRVQGVMPGGLRTSATEADGVVYFNIINDHPDAKRVRVVVFYPSKPETQYARDVWVPGQTTLATWMPLGPAPPNEFTGEGKADRTQGRSVEFVLFDRTDGTEKLILPPSEEKVRDRFISYRKREPTTALFADPEPDPRPPETYPPRLTAHEDAVRFARVFRDACGYSYFVSIVQDGFIPATPETFAGIDQVILASNTLRHDGPGVMALRHWVQQGGKLWIRLDVVDPALVAALLGDDIRFDIIDRVSLNSFVVKRGRDGAVVNTVRNLEQPVDLLRVVVPDEETVTHTIDGWPIGFVRNVGRGKIVFSTLGARGWYRERGQKDGNSPYYEMRDLPVRLDHFDHFAAELRLPQTQPAFNTDDLKPLLTEEIGYQIVSQKKAALVLLGFVAGLFGVGLLLRRSAHPERIGWVAPLFAGAAAVSFVAMGSQARHAVPPTTAAVQLVDAVPGTGEASVSGLFALYQPDSGAVPLATAHIGNLDLDFGGLDGQTRRRVQTDLGGWHWDRLELPAGVRMGPFRITTKPGALRASGRFNADGLQGRLQVPGYQDTTDAILVTPVLEPMGVRIQGDQFFVGRTEELGPGQYLMGNVLSDQQQRRQAIYHKMLIPPLAEHMENRTVLYAWAKSSDVPFTTGTTTRNLVTTLLQLPLELERTPPATKVYIPRGYAPVRRVMEKGLVRPTLEATTSVDMELRFALPPSVLPLLIEKMIVHLRVKAPGRTVTIAGYNGSTRTVLSKTTSPAEPLRIEITDPALLAADGQGGWRMHLAVGNAADTGAESDTRWKIESMTVEVVGQTK